ncbi:protein phosphatase 2C domain-containing protein [Kitasatospora sp. CB01950]|uniref:protein phosphatase 2C domain-containing protein n=1 Tax=Kitasatospora sp. CB01950 TaxID=1703930 RepID=UPI000939EC2C|nr:protein phosphatase 2C domain-containing protein [Kitasatospora sp. CB01950]OKJ08225.1 hypothetical protein AMK19_19570 [Kitasatospora sp. CB01950]
MNEQGAPRQTRPDDAWWHTVYAGPAGTLPDTPDAVPDTTSVDDWFTAAAGLFGESAPPPSESGATEVTPPPAESRSAESDSPESGATESGTAAFVPPQRSWAEAAWPKLQPAEDAQPTASPAPTGGAVTRVEAEPGVSWQKPEAPVAEPEYEPGPESAQEPEQQPDAAPAPAAEAAAETWEPEPVAPEPATVAEPRVAAAPPSQRGAPWREPEVPAVPHVGERPPTYAAEPTALPVTDPAGLAAVVPDTAIDGTQFAGTTLRAVSIRGDSARYRGEPRRDALLTVRFGDAEDGLVLTVLAGPARQADAVWGSAAATDAARQLAAAIGRSRAELAADLRAGARDRLRYGLQRIAVQAAARLRGETAGADEELPPPSEDAGSLHCLLMSTDPAATHRAAFGTGPGGLYLLRSGHWIDAYAARLLHHPDGQPPLPPAALPAPRPFRFRLVPATSGDILLLCTPGLAAPIAEEPAVAHFLSSHWAHPHPPGTVDFLRQIQVRAKGYADDRTAAAVWTE